MSVWQRWRHIAIIGLILVICVAPVWLAHVLIHRATTVGWSKHSSKGVLIHPVSVTHCQVWQDGRPMRLAAWPRRWHMVYLTRGCCDAACETALFHLNQIRRVIRGAWGHTEVVLMRPKRCHQALSKAVQPAIFGMNPVQRDAWQALLPKRLQETSSVSQVYLVDPKGYLMMGYPEADPALKVMSDLKHVLWVTRGDRSD